MQQILVVDDSATVRKMLKFAIDGSDYKVLEACDGLDALAALGRLEKDSVAMMITKLNMPHLDGIELIRKVRSDPDYRFLPIVLLSEAEDGRIREGQRAGASTLVIKPLNAQQIVETVELILGQAAMGGKSQLRGRA